MDPLSFQLFLWFFPFHPPIPAQVNWAEASIGYIYAQYIALGLFVTRCKMKKPMTLSV